MKLLVCGVAVAVGILLCAPAQATVWQWNDILIDGLQEVPPNASPGTGTGMATLDDVTGEINISGSYSDLIGTATLSHLHGPGAPDVNAGAIFALSNTGGTSGTFNGSSTLDSTQIGWVLDGLTYINVHTTSFAGGEIRGQLSVPVPEPGSLALVMLGLGSLIAVRRRHRRTA